MTDPVKYSTAKMGFEQILVPDVDRPIGWALGTEYIRRKICRGRPFRWNEEYPPTS